MHEFEAKFTGYTMQSARDLLQNKGYNLKHPQRLMTRKAYHIKGNKNKWGRVRDEGDKITLTIKELTENSLNGVKEAEIIINNFNDGAAVLEMCGFYEVAFQETKRELWFKGNIEVMIDTWPGLAPFLEVEGPNSTSVIDACTELGLNMDEALYGGVDVVYQKELGISADTINNTPTLTFNQPPKA
tara:strand:+ start:32892 stop:33449 length:558 start_codon:yes stop_codon:yes gene_type:complete